MNRVDTIDKVSMMARFAAQLVNQFGGSMFFIAEFPLDKGADFSKSGCHIMVTGDMRLIGRALAEIKKSEDSSRELVQKISDLIDEYSKH